MSRETYSEIRETLDRLSAPPGETIAERIEGLHRELGEAAARIVLAEREKLDAAMAALNAAGLYVAEGTLATGIEGLARRRDDALEELGAARHRADRMDAQWAAAERRAANLEGEVHDLRAETQRQQAQLDWAAGQFQAALRSGA
jgi:hypothetical protein